MNLGVASTNKRSINGNKPPVWLALSNNLGLASVWQWMAASWQRHSLGQRHGLLGNNQTLSSQRSKHGLGMASRRQRQRGLQT
jgi:hypothetical protein